METGPKNHCLAVTGMQNPDLGQLIGNRKALDDIARWAASAGLDVERRLVEAAAHCLADRIEAIRDGRPAAHDARP